MASLERSGVLYKTVDSYLCSPILANLLAQNPSRECEKRPSLEG